MREHVSRVSESFIEQARSLARHEIEDLDGKIDRRRESRLLSAHSSSLEERNDHISALEVARSQEWEESRKKFDAREWTEEAEADEDGKWVKRRETDSERRGHDVRRKFLVVFAGILVVALVSLILASLSVRSYTVTVEAFEGRVDRIEVVDGVGQPQKFINPEQVEVEGVSRALTGFGTTPINGVVSVVVEGTGIMRCSIMDAGRGQSLVYDEGDGRAVCRYEE